MAMCIHMLFSRLDTMLYFISPVKTCNEAHNSRD